MAKCTHCYRGYQVSMGCKFSSKELSCSFFSFARRYCDKDILYYIKQITLKKKTPQMPCFTFLTVSKKKSLCAKTSHPVFASFTVFAGSIHTAGDLLYWNNLVLPHAALGIHFNSLLNKFGSLFMCLTSRYRSSAAVQRLTQLKVMLLQTCLPLLTHKCHTVDAKQQI